jgi:hypothetical protein
LSTVVSAVFFGVVVGGLMTLRSQAMHKELVEAVAGLDQSERSDAIAAVTHGGMPTDPPVRSSAMRLGSAYLGHRSAEQLKRLEQLSWIMMAVLVAMCIAGAALTIREQRLYFLLLALLLAVAMTLAVLRTRRIQRNVALLAEGPLSE